jgi:aryl-alcohol dehydrogenase-like predicted oxidoreductase
MMFGARGNPDHDDCIRIVHRALDAGINIVDTADVYSNGESEVIVGKALAGGLREDVVLATKVNGSMGDDPNRRGNSRRWIMRAVEESLRRLQTDWIDLYQIHRFDPTCDIDETLGALTDLVRDGKVRYVGTSTFAAHEIVASQWASENRRFVRFVSEQPRYSILTREIEADVLPVCQRFGIAVLTWSPLAGGWLSGKYRKGLAPPSTRRSEVFPARYDMALAGSQARLDVVEQLARLAEETDVSLIDLSLAFVLQHPGVTAPIIGPRTLEQLESQLGATEIRLGPDVLDAIDRIVPPGGNPDPTDFPPLATPEALTDSRLRRRAGASSG